MKTKTKSVLSESGDGHAPSCCRDTAAAVAVEVAEQRAVPLNERDRLARRRKVVRGLKKLGNDAALAGAALNRAITTYVPLPRTISLFIDNIAPQPLIENRYGRVYFTIENMTDRPITGQVRATIQPKHSIDPIMGEFLYAITDLPPFGAEGGVISFLCPRADLQNRITLDFLVAAPADGGEDYGATVVAATASTEFDVGARFAVTMKDIQIRNTASHHNDTLLVTISGSKDGQTWTNEGDLGDHNNTDRGGFRPALGEYQRFDALPGEASGVGISYVIANFGHTSGEETAKKVLETISHVSAIVATTVCSIVFPVGTAVWAGLSLGVDQLIDAIVEYAFADCDTVVAIDAKFFGSDTLLSFTFDPNDSLSSVSPSSLLFRYHKKAGEILPGGDFIPGGGCDDSDYSVQLSIERYRPAELFHLSNPHVASPGQVISVGPLLPNWLQTAQVVFTNEGDGIVDEKGQYRAPQTAGFRKYDVITWTVNRDIGSGPEPWGSDFAIVLFD